MAESDREPPFEGGSQPVPQRPADMPGSGRSARPVVIVVLAVVILASALMFAFR